MIWPPAPGRRPEVQTDTAPWPMAPLFLGLLSCLPLIGAQFGYGNQIEQLTIVARLLDPGFAPGDVYLDSAASFGPRIYYAWGLAGLGTLLPLPLVIHTLSVATNLALAAVTYGATRRFLGAGALGGALAAILAVTNGSFSLGLAGYLRFDSFQPANIAIPASLGGFYLLLCGRAWAAVAGFALAMLMHPLIGVEIAAIAFGAAGLSRIWGRPAGDWWANLLPLIRAGLVFGVLVGLAWVAPTWGNEEKARLSGPEFFAILAEFRAPHHYLGFGFPRQSWVAAGIFAVVTGLIFARHMRCNGLQPATIALTAAGLVVIGLCAASLWFVDIAQNRTFVTAQLFRMLMVLKWVGFLGLGWVMAQWIARYGLAGWAMAAAGVLVTGDGQPLVLAPVLAVWLGLIFGPRILGWIKADGLWPLCRWGAMVALGLASLWLARRAGVEDQGLRALAAVGLILVLNGPPSPGRAAVAVAGTVALLGAAYMTRTEGLAGREGLKGQYAWADLTADEMQIARQVQAVTPPTSVWLIPPGMETFRMIAGRAVLVDYTSIPFDDASMELWYTRMARLYGPLSGGGFAALRAMEERHRVAPALARAAEMGATHAVLYAQTPWDGPVLAQTDTYKAVVLPAP